MVEISSREIKDKFLKFFQDNGHLLISNSSIIPKNDPTLLFINSGMAPIKRYFTGEEVPEKDMLCNVQTCIRTIDVESVGDKHHLTSFQMLGSWSINNYFKEKATFLAYKFLTEQLKIPDEKLYVTVFAGNPELNIPADEECILYWKKIGVQDDHIIRCGMDDNFWGPTSETGPCGPCTEVFYDTGIGEKYIKGGKFDTKNRYIEIWNAGVFMQFNKNMDGTFSKLNFSSVDTGAGLERLTMAINGFKSVYDTDLLRPIKEYIFGLLNGKSHSLPQKDVLIMSDHMRTVSIILSEKVSPSNEGRGYIPRKLIRKCMMILSKNKIYDLYLSDVSKFIINQYRDMYRYFTPNEQYIIDNIEREQKQFQKVLEEGISRLEYIKNNEKNISGKCAFELVTTYGLPYDIIREFANENNIFIDETSYKKMMEHHKEISKKSQEARDESTQRLFNEIVNMQKTEFLGYDNFENIGKVLYTFNDDKKVALVLDKTCMYAESGGQLSDKGKIFNNKFEANVIDVQKNQDGVFIHICEVKYGSINVNDIVNISIDRKRRSHLQNNHTSVHLLHAALKNIFGKDLNQCGSKVDENRLRLDFNYGKNIGRDEIFKIENTVNKYIMDNTECNIRTEKLDKAIKDGAIALFESKYGENVRVVTFGNISKELCGGTHTNSTGNIGLFIILSCESIGKGIKRISAVTGQDALDYVHNRLKYLFDIADLLKVQPENIITKVKKYLSSTHNKKIDNETILNRLTEKDVKFIDRNLTIKLGYAIIDSKYKHFMDDIVNLSDKLQSVIICLIKKDTSTDIVISVCKKIREKIGANILMKNIFSNISGKGGGNQRIASGNTHRNLKEICAYLEENFIAL